MLCEIRTAFVVILLLAVSMTGCESKTETDPAKLLPVLKAAQRCCDGHRCAGPYAGVPESVACADVSQLEACIRGDREQCPMKGHGAF